MFTVHTRELHLLRPRLHPDGNPPEMSFLFPLICMIMMASVRCAPASHWEGSPALVRESVPRTRMFVAASRPSATCCSGARVGMLEKGSPMVSRLELSE